MNSILPYQKITEKSEPKTPEKSRNRPRTNRKPRSGITNSEKLMMMYVLHLD